jgi:hypothetical protein
MTCRPIPLGLILIGVAGLFAAWFLPEGAPDRLGAVVINGLVIAIGAISLVQLREEQPFFDRLMWLMLVVGTGLLAYAFVIFRQARNATSGLASKPLELSRFGQ